MAKKFLTFFLFTINLLHAQKTWDSTRYVKYDSRFIFTVSQSYRQYNTEIKQFMIKDSLGKSKTDYFAESNHVTSIGINYDKIGFSFGIKSTEPKNVAQTGKTKFFNLGVNIGGNRWLLETMYYRYQGFYDRNTASRDTNYKHTQIYYQDPNLVNTLFKAKFLYFTNNKKFAFQSGYSSTYRQIKSAASWVLTANAYYCTLNSDSSFIPYNARSYYQDYSLMHGMDVFAFSVYAGASVNLVAWRALFINATLLFGPEEQWRTYKYIDGPFHRNLFYGSVSGDLRFSAGVNTKRFFMTISSVSDFFWCNSSSVGFLTKYITGNFSIGYRFKVKTPKFYQKIQQTKLYKMF